MPGREWTPGGVSELVVNPFYAIELAPHLCAAHTPLVSEELWIDANAKVIREVGPEAYLRALLAVLKGETS